VGNPACSRLSGGFEEPRKSPRPKAPVFGEERRLKAGGSQDWLPHIA